jgi:protein-disulfide isomerase
VNRRLFLALTGTLATATLLLATPATRKPNPKAPAAAPQTLVTVNGVAEIDPTKAFGSKNATVTMEIFSDFQCPACKKLFTDTTQKVTDNYANTGKVYIVHRDFPLPMHAYSRVAASYARAAAHIGKDEVVEQALFQNQERWEANGDVKGIVASVLSPAEMKKVQALVDGKTLEPLIDMDKQLGQAIPVNQTPTTIIHTKNGQTFPVVGFVSYDVLKQFLDQLVAQK